MYNSIGGYSNAARKGVSGLVSGLDTDNIVKGMSSATRSKIAKLIQSQQSITWKRDAYRSVSNKLIDFSDKYTSFSSSTNIMSEGFFDGSTITAKGANSKYVTATGPASTANGITITDILSVASAASKNSTDRLSSGSFSTGNIDVVNGKDVNQFAGQMISLEVDGKKFDVKLPSDFSGTTGADVAKAFNDTMKNIKFDETTNLSDKIKMDFTADKKFALSGTDSTVDTSIEITGGHVKALEMLDMEAGTAISKAGESISSKAAIDESKIVKNVTFSEALKDQPFVLNFNGVQKVITFDNPTFATLDEFKTALQTKIDSAFGAGKVIIAEDAGKLKFSTNEPTSTFTIANGSTIANDMLGIKNGISTKVNIAQSLGESSFARTLNFDADGKGVLDINGVKFEYTKDTSIKELMNDINLSKAGVKISYQSTTDTFNLTASESGAHTKIDIKDDTGNLSNVLFGTFKATDEKAGTDAKVTFKQGSQEFTLERTTNSFEVNGLTIKLSDDAVNFDKTAGDITFSGQGNTDDIVKGIKAMVDDYNAMVDYVNTELGTKRDRKYAPLTDEQREGMTEDQIKTWEEKAQKGLLFGDSDLRSMASDLRFAFSFNVNGVTSDLKSIGITTSTSYKDNGKIKLDETALKKALEERPDDVKKIFISNPDGENVATNDKGLMYRMKDTIDKYAATTGETKGVFIKKAGLKDSATELDSVMFKQLLDIDKSVKELNKKLYTEETRYYAQFTRLEQYMSQMNSQSSWLNQQFQ